MDRLMTEAKAPLAAAFALLCVMVLATLFLWRAHVAAATIELSNSEAALMSRQEAAPSPTPCQGKGPDNWCFTPSPTPSTPSEGGAGAGARGPATVPGTGGVPPRDSEPWVGIGLAISGLGLMASGFVLARRKN